MAKQYLILLLCTFYMMNGYGQLFKNPRLSNIKIKTRSKGKEDLYLFAKKVACIATNDDKFIELSFINPHTDSIAGVRVNVLTGDQTMTYDSIFEAPIAFDDTVQKNLMLSLDTMGFHAIELELLNTNIAPIDTIKGSVFIGCCSDWKYDQLIPTTVIYKDTTDIPQYTDIDTIICQNTDTETVVIQAHHEVTFKGGDFILLGEGTIIEDSSNFFAFIDECIPGVNKKSLNKDTIASISEPEITEFNIFPNPFSDYVFVNYSFNESAIVQMDLYNILGQKIKPIIANSPHYSGIYQIQLPTQDLEKGVYFLILATKKGRLVRKLVKQ